MADGNRKYRLQEGKNRGLPVQNIPDDPSHIRHDTSIAPPVRQMNNLQVPGIPVDMYRQRPEGQQVHQHPQDIRGAAPSMPYVNKYVHFQAQPQQQLHEQSYYNGVNYVPRMYPEMRGANVPTLTMMYCGMPNPPVNMNDMRYAAPWNMHKLETNVHAKDLDGWVSRSNSMHSNSFAFEQGSNHSRKPKGSNSISNKKVSKSGNGKSATDGMAVLPLNDDVNHAGSLAMFEDALKQSLLLEVDDGLHKLKVTQESLGNLVDVKELSCSEKSGMALYGKFEGLSNDSIVYLCREFSGSKIIQQCLDKNDDAFAEIMYSKLKKYQKLLSIDTYGNYVVQHLLQSKSAMIQNELGLMLEENLLPLSLNFYGCRVIQMAIKHLPAEFCDRCCTKIAPVALYCLQSQHANHVIKAFFPCKETGCQRT